VLVWVNDPASGILSRLGPSDFQFFPTLKEFWGGMYLKNDEEMKDAVKERLNGIAAEVNDEDTQELVTMTSVSDDCRKIT
jgi:hypothetical protein